MKGLSPRLYTDEYVFVCVQTLEKVPLAEIIALFRETEGLTLVLKKTLANELRLPYSFIAARISLEMETSLNAIGITAYFSTLLAKAGISCNVFAGYYHDHLFVPFGKRNEALQLLKDLNDPSIL